MNLTPGTNETRFRNNAFRLREYIAFADQGLLIPRAAGRVLNQNLHQPVFAGMIILTTAPLMEQARRLAEHHLQRENLVVVVTDVNQVYHEFSSGTPDPVALRDYVKMFYDRAGADTTKRPTLFAAFWRCIF